MTNRDRHRPGIARGRERRAATRALRRRGLGLVVEHGLGPLPTLPSLSPFTPAHKLRLLFRASCLCQISVSVALVLLAPEWPLSPRATTTNAIRGSSHAGRSSVQWLSPFSLPGAPTTPRRTASLFNRGLHRRCRSAPSDVALLTAPPTLASQLPGLRWSGALERCRAALRCCHGQGQRPCGRLRSPRLFRPPRLLEGCEPGDDEEVRRRLSDAPLPQRRRRSVRAHSVAAVCCSRSALASRRARRRPVPHPAPPCASRRAGTARLS